MGLTTKWVLSWIAAVARVFREKQGVLAELDEVIGDGDHGENLARGFSAAEERLSNYVVSTPSKALRTTGAVLLAAVGGASGPLLGTAFLRAAKAIPKDATEIDAQGIAMMLVKAAEGIAERGGAEPGGKTMLDVWYPAATNAAAALAKGSSCTRILQVAADAAAKGAQSTLSMTAEKGRASLLGERSIGHLDPGAISTSWILEAAAATAGQFENPEASGDAIPDAEESARGQNAHLAQEVLKNLESQIPREIYPAESPPDAAAAGAAASTGSVAASPAADTPLPDNTAESRPATVTNLRPPIPLAPHESSYSAASAAPVAPVAAPTPATPATPSPETQAESFQSAALRLLSDDPEAPADEKAGAQIASALGIDLARENAAESAL